MSNAAGSSWQGRASKDYTLLDELKTRPRTSIWRGAESEPGLSQSDVRAGRSSAGVAVLQET